MNPLTPSESEAILSLCLLAAFADGEKCDLERAQIRRISSTLQDTAPDLHALCQRVLLNPPSIETLSAQLGSTGAKRLAYEMVVCVVEADNVRIEQEKQFLAALRQSLGLSASLSGSIDAEVATLAMVPVPSEPAPSGDSELDAMILRYAIFAGALELLPQNLATLAVVPLQTKMVYRLAKQHGLEPDRRTVAELLAAVGMGLASQVFEGFARRLGRKLGKKVAGKWGGRIADTVTGCTVSFAATYALGHLASAYYAGGRTMSLDAMRSRFTQLSESGKQLASQHLDQITAQSDSLTKMDLRSVMKAFP